ncbi:MAG TPA: hypothetical protein VNA19_13175 [Pyrinomonadaceae bacterium]|nr:hypothetical protein [Pyrinomonadaceae bacterium]
MVKQDAQTAETSSTLAGQENRRRRCIIAFELREQLSVGTQERRCTRGGEYRKSAKS